MIFTIDGGRDLGIRQRVEMVITTKDDHVQRAHHAEAFSLKTLGQQR